MIRARISSHTRPEAAFLRRVRSRLCLWGRHGPIGGWWLTSRDTRQEFGQQRNAARNVSDQDVLIVGVGTGALGSEPVEYGGPDRSGIVAVGSQIGRAHV